MSAPDRGNVPATAPPILLAPRWLREPYRVLFPEALFLGWVGVGVWLLYALGAFPARHQGFHAIAQIEGFVSCIAAGFLFTFLPRRVPSSPATRVEVALAMLAPAVALAAGALGAEIPSLIPWLVFIGVLLAFASSRLGRTGAALRLPNAIVWVPAGLLLGAAGAVLRAWGLEAENIPLRLAGQGMLAQGMLTALVVGVGATLLPVLTRGEPHAETKGTPRDAAAKALHAAGAVLFAASFFVEAWRSSRFAFILRAVVVLAALLLAARIHRPPTVPGLHRRMVWLAAWLIPVGYGLAGFSTRYAEAALHVVYIGGFALMALSVAYHVALAHGGNPGALSGRPWPLVAMYVLLLAAVVLRALADMARTQERLWIALAAAAFLVATGCWATLAMPRLRSSPP